MQHSRRPFDSLSLSPLIHERCDAFEQSWKTGPRPRLEEFLLDISGLERAQLLRELLLLDWEHRRRSGEEPLVTDYADRFPNDRDLLKEVAATTSTLLRSASEEMASESDNARILSAAPANLSATVSFAASDHLTATRDAHATPSTTQPETAPWPQLCGYEVLGELGRGGMGVVYKARDLQLKRLVAIKMILAGAHAHQGELQRFRIEAEAIARLQHPNIVQIHAIGEHSGLPFVVLEFLDGGSLREQLGGNPVPSRDAARIVEILARAMQVAHEHGIVHRDLKPANVLLSTDGIPKISDFGLAKRLEEESGQTQTGDVMGTPSYMSPEQALGDIKSIGPATDIYALGAILYELLTGRPPFKAATPMETLRQVLDQEPVSPRQLNPSIERDVETIALKGLDKIPSRRFDSAAAFADDLQRYLTGNPILARLSSPWERAWRWCRRNAAVASLACGMAVILLAGITVSVYFAIDARKEKNRADELRIKERSARFKAEDLAKKETAARLKADELAVKERDARIRAENLAKLWMADVEIKEGDEGVRNAQINIILPEAQKNGVTLNLSTIDGTARAGVDYIPISSTVTFKPDLRGIVTINVVIVGDRIKEPDEEFYLRITNSSVTVATTTARIRIVDDD